MHKDDHLIFEAFMNKVFTVVSGGTDNSSEQGFDINPPEYVQAADLKNAVEQMIHSDDYDDETWDPDFREYKKDYFVMSTDGGDWVYVFPGQLNDTQAYDRILATGDYGSENAESADEKKERVQRGWDINKKRWAKWKAENPEAAAKHAARKAGKSENAEEQNRIVGNDVIQNDQVIGEFLGDSYSSKLTLNGKDMFMPGAPYAQTVNQGTHMGLWYKNKRHKLVVRDASKWKEFLSDIIATGDDKYWDGKKMHQHDHIGDEISATNEYWSKKIAAGADQTPAENAEGVRSDVSNGIRVKLGQAYDIVKGLIEMLDKTPAEQTPYNEMVITHIANLEEDIKTLSHMLQDRMLNK